MNSVQVNGNAINVESINWEQLEKFPDRRLAITDMNIATVEQAQERGEAILTNAELDAVSGLIRVPVNCGQQLNDVILINEPKAGLSGAKRRVKGIELTYHPRLAVYEQKILLEGV
jgi:hypothetical protein